MGAALVAVSPDLGRVKLARRLSGRLGADLAVVTKTRPGHDLAEAAEVVGAVRGKVVVMGDDMIVTGSTLVSATEALLAAGALEVRAFATHALFAEGALERLQASELAELAVTDTVRIARAETLEADRALRCGRARRHDRERLRRPVGVGAVRRAGALLNPGAKFPYRSEAGRFTCARARADACAGDGRAGERVVVGPRTRRSRSRG